MTTQTKLGTSESLAALDERLQAAQEAATKVDQEQSAARHRVREIEAEIERALAADQPTTKLDAQFAEAKRNRDETPWDARRQAASDRVRKITAEHSEFVTKEIDALIAPFVPRAHEAVSAVENALGSVEAALAEWQAVASELTKLLAVVPGLDGQDIPMLPMAFDLLNRELHRAKAAEIPPPLPRSVGPEKLSPPPKTRTQSGGYVDTLVNARGEVVSQ